MAITVRVGWLVAVAAAAAGDRRFSVVPLCIYQPTGSHNGQPLFMATRSSAADYCMCQCELTAREQTQTSEFLVNGCRRRTRK